MSKSKQEQKHNKNKYWDWAYYISSILIAATVGLGEALVAVYFMGPVTISLVIAVGLPAFLVNFLLFKSDVFDLLKSFFNDELFKDKLRDSNGALQPFTGTKAIILKIAMGLSIFAGVACGFLQLNSILTTFGTLLWGLSATMAISAPPLSLMVIAGSVALFSALANTALLYANIEKFVREGEYQQYIDIFNSIFGLEQDPDKKLKFGWKIYHGLFAVIGLLCAVSVYMITLGLYKSQAFTVFNTICNFSKNTSVLLTNLVVHPGQILNGFFYGVNIVYFVRAIEGLFKNLVQSFYFTKVQHQHQQKHSKDSNNPAPNSGVPFRAIFLFFSSIAVFLGLLYCSLKNGLAQGRGAMTEAMSLDWLKTLKMPSWLANKFVFVVMTTASTSANAFACWNEVKPSDKNVAKVMNFVGFGYGCGHGGSRGPNQKHEHVPKPEPASP